MEHLAPAIRLRNGGTVVERMLSISGEDTLNGQQKIHSSGAANCRRACTSSPMSCPASALEALNGMILFGLTTAFLFVLIQKVLPLGSRVHRRD
jgi:hypothetical protein